MLRVLLYLLVVIFSGVPGYSSFAQVGYDAALDPMPYPEIYELIRDRKCEALKVHPDYGEAVWSNYGDRPAERMILEGICFDADPYLARQVLEDRVIHAIPAASVRGAVLLGKMMEEGIGGPRDPQRAERLYWESAVAVLQGLVEPASEGGYGAKKDDDRPVMRLGVDYHTYEVLLYDRYLGAFDLPARYLEIVRLIEDQIKAGEKGLLGLHENMLKGQNGFPKMLPEAVDVLRITALSTGNACYSYEATLISLGAQADFAYNTYGSRYDYEIWRQAGGELIAHMRKGLPYFCGQTPEFLALTLADAKRMTIIDDLAFYYMLLKFEEGGNIYKVSSTEILEKVESRGTGVADILALWDSTFSQKDN